MNDLSLLHKLKKGRRDALEAVIDNYTPYVTSIVYQVIGRTMTREDMEEVVSDVFLALWDHAKNLDEEKGDIRTYIGAIARNKAKNKLRQYKPQTDLEDWVAWDYHTPEKEVEDREAQATIWELIMSLGEPDSEIFLRYYHYDQEIREISKKMGLTTAAIKTKLFRGRKKLKELLTAKGGSGYEAKTEGTDSRA